MIRNVAEPRALAASTPQRHVERRLAAIMGADIAGYSILMSHDEEDTHRRVGAELEYVFREIEKARGRVFSFAGDGLMAEFPSAVEALKCALRLQADSGRRNAQVPSDQRIVFRVGLNVGEVVVEAGRSGGNAVNIAARLEGIAEPGGIAISEAVYQQVSRTVVTGYSYAGGQHLKNIREPVAVYMISSEECLAWAGGPALPRQAHGRAAGDMAPDYRASLAVLPFRTLTKDQSDSYFAEGVVDDIIHALGGLKDLLVISRSSTQTFARAPLDVRRIGHELDVRYVLHGSVRRAGGSLRMAIELCEASTGSIIWLHRLDGMMDDLFALQDEVALRVATSIAPHLREQELRRALRKRPDSMTAYDFTLQALDLFHRADRASLESAAMLLNKAIKADPKYGPAYSHLAGVRMRTIAQGWAGNQTAEITQAAELARLALERDQNDPIALAIYGHVQSYLLKDFASATEYLDRALDIGPSCALAWAYSGLTCGYLGRFEMALERAERAVRLCPVGIDACRFQHYLSMAHYMNDRFDDAVAWGRMSATLAPANISNLLSLTVSLVAVNDLEAARECTRELMRLVPTFRLSAYRARTPLHPDIADRAVRQMRLAGLPD